jgi:hypothetical protein
MSLIPLIPYALLIVGTGAAFMGAFGLYQLWRDARGKRLAHTALVFNTGGGGTGC